MQITGTITQCGQYRTGTSQRTGQPWASQNYVMEYGDGNFIRHFVFTVFGADRIQQFAVQQGETLTVDFDIDARQAQNGQWYNDVKAWRVQRGQQQAQSTVQPQQQATPQQQQVYAPQNYNPQTAAYQQQQQTQQQRQPAPPKESDLPF